MTESLNLIIEKMKTRYYTSNWIFSKSEILETPTYSNWRYVFKRFLDAALLDESLQHPLELSSDLISSQLSSDI